MTAFDQLRQHLGQPTYESPGVLIYQGDCVEYLRRLADESVPLTVTSPPYNIGKDYEEVLPLEKYLDWCEEWIGEIYRVTSPSGALWLNLGYIPVDGRGKAIPIPYFLWNRIPFYLQQEIVWHYEAGVAARTSFSPRNEKFLWYVKSPEDFVFNLDDVRDPNVKYPNQKKNGKLRCNPKGKNPGDVWSVPKVTSGRNRSSKERTKHPAQFPVGVIDRVVRACSKPGDTVIDPFLGSGTTAEVALRTGRQCIGFEIQPDYLEIAVERLEAARVDLESQLFYNSP